MFISNLAMPTHFFLCYLEWNDNFPSHFFFHFFHSFTLFVCGWFCNAFTILESNFSLTSYCYNDRVLSFMLVSPLKKSFGRKWVIKTMKKRKKIKKIKMNHIFSLSLIKNYFRPMIGNKVNPKNKKNIKPNHQEMNKSILMNLAIN